MASTRLVVTSRSRTACSPSPSMDSSASPARVSSSASFAGAAFTATNSRSHVGEIFISKKPLTAGFAESAQRPQSLSALSGSPSRSLRFAFSRELLQKPHSPLEQERDVVDLVLHHGDSVHAHAEGEAGDLLRVIPVRFHEAEDRRVHHA